MAEMKMIRKRLAIPKLDYVTGKLIAENVVDGFCEMVGTGELPDGRPTLLLKVSDNVVEGSEVKECYLVPLESGCGFCIVTEDDVLIVSDRATDLVELLKIDISSPTVKIGPASIIGDIARATLYNLSSNYRYSDDPILFIHYIDDVVNWLRANFQ